MGSINERVFCVSFYRAGPQSCLSDFLQPIGRGSLAGMIGPALYAQRHPHRAQCPHSHML